MAPPQPLFWGGARVKVRPGTSFSSRHSTSRIELSAAPEEKRRFPSGCQATPSQAWSSAIFWITCRALEIHDAQAGLGPAVVRDHEVPAVGVERHGEGQVAGVEVRPAGAMRQPLGRSVTPWPCGPGRDGLSGGA